MDYTNEKCPVCKKAFKEDDDIVVCPVCGTPHHRQCYADNGVCANDGGHSSGFEWTPSASSHIGRKPKAEEPDDGHKMVFCPYCGKENPAEEPVCTNCGARLYNNGEKGVFSQPVVLPDMTGEQFGNPIVRISPDDTIGGNKVSDTAEYIQMNAGRYIPKMYKMEKTGSKASFNWSAFLFSPYWFFFRKMHIVGFVLILIMLASTFLCTTDRVVSAVQNYETVAESYYQGNATEQEVTDASYALLSSPEVIILSIIQIGVHVFGGVFGNYLYKRKVQKDISEIKSNASSSEEYRLLLFKRGGVSGIMCSLAVLGYYCAEQLVYSFIAK